MPAETAAGRYGRYRRLLADVPLPAALVDLDAVDENAERLLGPVRRSGKRLRLATKSIRCPWLIRYLCERGAGAGIISGLMTYSAGETLFLCEQGFTDLLLAYPTVQRSDAALVAAANRRGATAAVVVDDAEQLAALQGAATAAAVTIPVVIELDVAYRPLGRWLHLGVRRSPLRSAGEVVALMERLREFPALRLHGLLAYEAHIAGLTDRNPFSAGSNLPKRVLKRLFRPEVARARREVVEALRARGLLPAVVNGGGSGSLSSALDEEILTEVTAGSGFLDSHLFDYYQDLDLLPAIGFALQVVRRPGPDLVTCHGGGLVASGEAGPDRLPRPWLPEGMRLLPREGAGEVQTPLLLAPGTRLALGDPVFLRHAKAGELAEHFNEYLLIRGDRIEARAPTYRGLGHSFLG